MSSIDVIVPCYRYGRYLRTCVESLLDQGVSDLRVLIIDDESPDETPEVARALMAEDPRVHYRRHEKNRGHIATYNEGIDWLEADYMMLISADDFVLPGAFKRAMALMDARPDIAFTFGDATAHFDDGTGRPITVRFGRRDSSEPTTVLDGLEFIDACTEQGAANIVPTPTAIVRTKLLHQVGGYDPALPHTADLEMWLRLAAHGAVGHFQGPQAAYRQHAANMSLGYARENVMRDVLQRQVALETFVKRCASRLPDGEGRGRRLFSALAVGSLGLASTAFNNGDFALSRQLCDFARGLDPRVTRSMAWRTLRIKRLIGHKLTNMALPALARWRRRAAT